jgi:hypothetical protein
MCKLHAVLTALVFSSYLQLAAQETIVQRCHAPHDPFDNQVMPEQFKIPDLPKTARQVTPSSTRPMHYPVRETYTHDPIPRAYVLHRIFVIHR